MLKAKVNGIEIEAETAADLAALIDFVQEEIPAPQVPAPIDFGSYVEQAWETTKDAAECVYTSSMQDVVNGICDGCSSFIDWATKPSNK